MFFPAAAAASPLSTIVPSSNAAYTSVNAPLRALNSLASSFISVIISSQVSLIEETHLRTLFVIFARPKTSKSENSSFTPSLTF